MKPIRLLLCLAFCAVAAAACGPAAPSTPLTGPRVWLDAPLDGTALPLAPVEIVSHATGPIPITVFELSVNGAITRTDPNADSAKELVTARQSWTPPAAGNYTLMVRAQNKAGAWSEYARAVVVVGGPAVGGVVQGMVYTDLNNNGLPNDPGDTPLDGVLVTLSGCASATTTTAAGSWKFAGLPTGTCLVQVAKTGWKFSGTFPAGIGYPAKAASDPALPTSFSIFMAPSASPTPVHAVVTPSLVPAAKGVTVTPLPAATIAFFADQTKLVAGQCTTLHWQTTNMSQVFLDEVVVAANGSKTDCLRQTTTHTLRAVTLDKQTARRSVTINVVPPTPIPSSTPTTVPRAGCSGTPNISSFTASPAMIVQGASSTLSWGAVTNADSVTIDPGIGGVGTPGSRVVSPSTNTTYTLTARCGTSAVSRQVTVTVQAVRPRDTTGPAFNRIATSSTVFFRSGCSPNNITVTANVTDASGVASVQLSYRVGSSRGYTTVTLDSAGGNDYRKTISGSEVPGSSFGTWQFYLTARDTLGNTSNSASNTSVMLNQCVR